MKRRSLMEDTRPRAVVLVSGGLDSAVALAVTLAEGFKTTALVVDYGQRNREREVVCGRMQSGHQGADLKVVEFLRKFAEQEGGEGVSPHYVPGRNGVLVAMALSVAESIGAVKVVLGATAEDRDGFPDCRPAYIAKWNELAALGMARAPEVTAPLSAMTKAEVILRGIELGVDFARTWSCYGWEEVPCGTCGACVVRARGFAEARIVDPLKRAL